MDPLVPELVAAVGTVAPRPAAIALYSTVDGAARPGETWDAAYWGRNLRRPVRFGPTVERMVGDGIDVFLEVGPHPTLMPSIVQAPTPVAPTAIGSLRRDEDERVALLAGLGALWAAGHHV